MWRFHAKALSLIPGRPSRSASAAAAIEARERALGIKLPESVREWYTLDGAVEMLRTYSNADRPESIAELGRNEPDWYGLGPRDGLADSLLIFMYENQGVGVWAVELNGSDDPLVQVNVDPGHGEGWKPCASSFSEFIYCQIWDWSLTGAICEANAPPLKDHALQGLRRAMREEPSTNVWPGNHNYRFSSTNGRVRLSRFDSAGSDWLLLAHGEEELVRLLGELRSIGIQLEDPYGWDEAGKRAVARTQGS
jgi:hypothetical protein